jgi:hypothetical protein
MRRIVSHPRWQVNPPKTPPLEQAGAFLLGVEVVVAEGLKLD